MPGAGSSIGGGRRPRQRSRRQEQPGGGQREAGTAAAHQAPGQRGDHGDDHRGGQGGHPARRAEYPRTSCRYRVLRNKKPARIKKASNAMVAAPENGGCERNATPAAAAPGATRPAKRPSPRPLRRQSRPRWRRGPPVGGSLDDAVDQGGQDDHGQDLPGASRRRGGRNGIRAHTGGSTTTPERR